MTPFYEQVYWIYFMSVLDVKRTKQDFLKNKCKSSKYTLTYIHTSYILQDLEWTQKDIIVINVDWKITNVNVRNWNDRET